jgi:hypothetical protein
VAKGRRRREESEARGGTMSNPTHGMTKRLVKTDGRNPVRRAKGDVLRMATWARKRFSDIQEPSAQEVWEEGISL